MAFERLSLRRYGAFTKSFFVPSVKQQSYPIWHESERKRCFQRGMSLKRGSWVDHREHGDRYERRPVGDVAAVAAVCRRDDGGRVSAMRQRRGSLPTYRGVLRRFRHGRLKRADKGLIMRYVMRTAGYSRPQLVRLIKRARVGLLKKGYSAPTHGFVRRFSEADAALKLSLDQTDSVGIDPHQQQVSGGHKQKAVIQRSRRTGGSRPVD